MLTLDELRLRGESLTESVEREFYLTRSGQKPNAQLQAIYDRHPDVASDEALALCLNAFQSADRGSEHSLRLLLSWQVELAINRRLAPIDEKQLQWESTATVTLSNGDQVPYRGIDYLIASAPRRGDRVTLNDARTRAIERGLAPIRRERLEQEMAIVASLGLGSYLELFHRLNGFAVDPLCHQASLVLAATDAMWEKLHSAVITEPHSLAPQDADRSDVYHWLFGREFDDFFSPDFEQGLGTLVSGMGIHPTGHGRIIYDTQRREGKDPRPFYNSVRIPEEIYLVVSGGGGRFAWKGALHEIGHCLHWAHCRRDLPFEFRRLGDASITEAYALLFDHLLHEPLWLREHTALSGEKLARFYRDQAFLELFHLRRSCAKLLWERDVYSGAAELKVLEDRYEKQLMDITRFRYPSANAFIDLDPRLYVTRYLRAWQLQGGIRARLVTEFGPAWWKHRDSGQWLADNFWAKGQQPTADQLSLEITNCPLSFDETIRATGELVSLSSNA